MTLAAWVELGAIQLEIHQLAGCQNLRVESNRI